jgi:predicted nucleotidyltransferase
MKLTENNIKTIKELCKLYKVKSFSVFGSVLRNDFKPESDLDFVVDFEESDPIVYTDLYFGLKQKLENTLGRKIDLIELRAIKNSFLRKEIESSKVLIYG